MRSVKITIMLFVHFNYLTQLSMKHPLLQQVIIDGESPALAKVG